MLGRQTSGERRQEAGARAQAGTAMTPKEMAAAKKASKSPLARLKPTPGEPDPEAASDDKANEPLVRIEVELVSPSINQAVELTSLANFRHAEYMPPFERAVDNVVSRYSSSSAPLSKVFYLVFRDVVDDPSAPGGKSFQIKWTAAMMMCYCPFKQGGETLEEVNKCLPDGQEFEGYGDGCTYWHGKLVPGTRVRKVQWLESPAVIEAVLQATSVDRRDRPQLKENLVSSMGRVVTRFFFNSRTLISPDKYELQSFDRIHLQLKDTRSETARAAATDANEVRRLIDSTNLVGQGLNNKPGTDSQLIISDVRVHATSQPPHLSSQCLTF